MIKKIPVLLVYFFSFLTSWSQETVLKKNMVIRKSIQVKQLEYDVPANTSLTHPLIVIEGNNIVVDFNEAVLNGAREGQTPDQFEGVAILVKKGKNITIRNLRVKGYKIALLANHTEGLKLEHCDFSYNYRAHLRSRPEDPSDSMIFRSNEKDEWLKYGAAIYLKHCKAAVVQDCKVTGGQNALMLVACSAAEVFNNDFSFNSGIGIALYQSSNNKIGYNKLNFNVRSFFERDHQNQGGMGILVYPSSDQNLFYKNSVTHGGGGLSFAKEKQLFSGEKARSDNNQILYNDFSYAVGGGIELGSGSNLVAHNRIFGCDYGIRGSYSFRTTLQANQLRNNRIGIDLENGQHNGILNNLFLSNKVAIRLWSTSLPLAPNPGPKYPSHRSAGYLIALNSFNGDSLVYRLSNTDSLNVFGNTYSGNDQLYETDTTVSNLDSFNVEVADTGQLDYTVQNPIDPFRGNGRLSGRQSIMMTEWGPYDFGYPFIRQIHATDTSAAAEFEFLGPRGNWKLISMKGLQEPRASCDSFPCLITAARLNPAPQEIEIIAEYRGAAFIDGFGRKIPADQPYQFRFKRVFSTAKTKED